MNQQPAHGDHGVSQSRDEGQGKQVPFGLTGEGIKDIDEDTREHVIDAHGWQIDVESTLGHNSIFTISIPLNTNEEKSI